MKLKDEQDLSDLIQQDDWMMHILTIVRGLNLPDCWIGAGFVRSKVWDHLHDKNRTSLEDVDVIYFDLSDINEAQEKKLEQELKSMDRTVPWSVKNQARMHIPAGDEQYSSTAHAVSLWPETATSVAVRLTSDNEIEVLAPHGIEDLLTMTINPTPRWEHKPEAYEARLAQKNWPDKWPKVKVNHVID